MSRLICFFVSASIYVGAAEASDNEGGVGGGVAGSVLLSWTRLGCIFFDFREFKSGSLELRDSLRKDSSLGSPPF